MWILKFLVSFFVANSLILNHFLEKNTNANCQRWTEKLDFVFLAQLNHPILFQVSNCELPFFCICFPVGHFVLVSVLLLFPNGNCVCWSIKYNDGSLFHSKKKEIGRHFWHFPGAQAIFLMQIIPYFFLLCFKFT